jgi:polyisoprenoid-binding protein YceI
MENKEIPLTRWKIDRANSEISFEVKHVVTSLVKGIFNVFDANVYTHANDFSTAEINVWIEADSIDTLEATRNSHLKSEDFLDVKRHKQITFTASTIGKIDADGKAQLWGELTIIGVKRNIKLDAQFTNVVKDLSGNQKVEVTIASTINRADWELRWNSPVNAGEVLVAEEVAIFCEIQLTNSAQRDEILELDYGVQPQSRLYDQTRSNFDH